MPPRPPILEENVANMAPTWVLRWSQNGEKIDAKIDQKFDASWDRFLLGFWSILGGKCVQVGPKMGSQIDGNFERRFLIIRAPAQTGARKIKILGWKLGAKICQKWIKKRSPRWDASWHRFFSDFGGFLEPCWEAKSSKHRSKKASKKRCKKEGHQDGQQDAP